MLQHRAYRAPSRKLHSLAAESNGSESCNIKKGYQISCWKQRSTAARRASQYVTALCSYTAMPVAAGEGAGVGGAAP